jgi:hypothetical protein
MMSLSYMLHDVTESFREREQQKRVLLLDKTFQVLEDIPLDIGPRHHQVHWRSDRAALQSMQLGDRDRVRVTVPALDHEAALAWKADASASGANC